jgi:hypothetical protein
MRHPPTGEDVTHPPINMLVVDFDYFFPIDQAWEWSHFESPVMIEGPLWDIRASSFDGGDLPPLTGEQDTFWSRFNHMFGSTLYYADSNMWAVAAALSASASMAPTPLAKWGVWLFDQHHDSGYGNQTPGVTCENWMKSFAGPESKERLHVVYPDWHELAFDIEPEPEIPIDRRHNAEIKKSELPAFDLTFVCRSGAWVPPWHDDAFFKFIEEAPHFTKTPVGPIVRRQIDTEHVQKLLDAQRNLRSNP